jgi:hypothetical protein
MNWLVHFRLLSTIQKTMREVVPAWHLETLKPNASDAGLLFRIRNVYQRRAGLGDRKLF